MKTANRIKQATSNDPAPVEMSDLSTKPHPYILGQPYFIRTITHHYTGRLVGIYDNELVLVDAAWIADDGKFSEALCGSGFQEVEPYPDNCRVIISRASLLDVSMYPHPLPRAVK